MSAAAPPGSRSDRGADDVRALVGAERGAGADLHALCARLYPFLRSITGDGVRRTLAVVGEQIPITVTEVPSGTPAFDWAVPNEWTVREAWLRGPDGRVVCDVGDHNLHLVNYSAPFRGRLSLAELRPRLFSLPDRPDWIPYRTSYFKEDWGFCLRHRDLEALEDGIYDVCVDTTLAPGALTFGECVLPGRTDAEVLVSAHVCHPSLANDNLSGIAVASRLAALLSRTDRRFTWRFVFAPSTIGVITWLSQREDVVRRVEHGIVISGVGDPGSFHYKSSRRGNTEIDRIWRHVLAESAVSHRILPFMPYGYDERQYCSPGFDLAVGCFSRSTYGSYPQYHTSADDLSFIGPDQLEESLGLLLRTASVLERNVAPLNLSPKGEPQLGRRGLYSLIGGHNESQKMQLALLWVLNQGDGRQTLIDIAERAGLSFDLVDEATVALKQCGLVQDAVASNYISAHT
jgi:aminopeptidase-like protein